MRTYLGLLTPLAFAPLAISAQSGPPRGYQPPPERYSFNAFERPEIGATDVLFLVVSDSA
jgi:hypothetical protein